MYFKFFSIIVWIVFIIIFIMLKIYDKRVIDELIGFFLKKIVNCLMI